MNYRVDNDKIYVSLIKDENIFDSIYEIATKEKIKSGWINGIGAIENVRIGAYDLKNKKYNEIDLEGVYELTSLMGNVTYNNNKLFLHVHVNLSNHNCESFGGHLFSADINATGEFIIQIFNEKINRTYDSDIGLCLWNLNKNG